MGLTWTIGNVSGYVEGIENAPKWTETVFFITDTMNAMQGIFIFLIFICKRDIYLSLVKRFNSIS